MYIRYKTIPYIIFILFWIHIPRNLLAQRRNQERRTTYKLIESDLKGVDLQNTDRRRMTYGIIGYNKAIIGTRDIPDVSEKTGAKQLRNYDIEMDLGLGNFMFQEFVSATSPLTQSTYTGDVLSFKALVNVKEIEGRWAIDFGGELMNTSEQPERWWSGQKLFRVNKFFMQGLAVETTVNYSFEDMGLSPYPVLATPFIRCGLVYRFFGFRRKEASYFIDNETNIPNEMDIALFGTEPGMGLLFLMKDGRTMGYVNISFGIYGASVESNYTGRTQSTSPDKTYAKSILAKLGLRGTSGKFFYQLGYTIARFDITAKNSISKSHINMSRLVGNLGFSF